MPSDAAFRAAVDNLIDVVRFDAAQRRLGISHAEHTALARVLALYAERPAEAGEEWEVVDGYGHQQNDEYGKEGTPVMVLMLRVGVAHPIVGDRVRVSRCEEGE